MDLSTTYLGLRLANPIIPGASPLSGSLDSVRRLEDAGAPAIVLRSLFEEEIRQEMRNHLLIEEHVDAFPESRTFFPPMTGISPGPTDYFEHLRRVKAAVSIPVIGSLNGVSAGAWTEYARRIEEAGADALELNVYFLATDVAETGTEVEARCVEIARDVKSAVTIPVAVKLSPFYSSFANLARRLDLAGVDGIVLFNRFYQPDIDVLALETVPSLGLSDSSELRLRLRWLAVLHGRVGASLAASGGVHTAVDVVKALMAGADAVQMVSALLMQGSEHLARVRQALTAWLEENEYDGIKALRGSMSLRNCPDPKALERANYMQVLGSWRG